MGKRCGERGGRRRRGGAGVEVAAEGGAAAGFAVEAEAGGEVIPRGGRVGGAGGGEAGNEHGLHAAPGGAVGKEDVAVGDPEAVGGEEELVVGRAVGVVVAGEVGDLGHGGGEEGAQLGFLGGGDAVLEIAGIAVEHEVIDADEERAQARKLADAAGGFEEV